MCKHSVSYTISKYIHFCGYNDFFFLIHLKCSLYVLGVLLVFVACIVCAVAHIRSTPLWQPCEKVAANVAYDEFNCLPKHLREITLEKLVDYIE